MNGKQTIMDALVVAAAADPEKSKEILALRQRLERGGIELRGTGVFTGLCDECDDPAVWVRKTQFSGNHHFCRKHAEAEENFGESDPSYFFWEKLEPEIAPA